MQTARTFRVSQREWLRQSHMRLHAFHRNARPECAGFARLRAYPSFTIPVSQLTFARVMLETSVVMTMKTPTVFFFFSSSAVRNLNRIV